MRPSASLFRMTTVIAAPSLERHDAVRMGRGGTTALAAAIGVTRVARLTGLDRTGVEVASAIRPGGHILQVSNGKGRDWASAERGALHEAAELWAAEQPLPSPVEARIDQLDSAIPPQWLGGADSPGIRSRWVRARRLDATGEVWVPASAVACPPIGLGPIVASWTSNGMGAHPDLEPALFHALCEAWERESLAQVLPRGWSGQDLNGRRVGASHPAFEREGFALALFDLTPDSGLAPVAGALLRDLEHGPIPLTAGYASRPTLEDAIEAAILEAAQSRQTEIHAAREDVAVPRSFDVAALWATIQRARPSRRKVVRGPTGAAALARRFRRPVAWVELGAGKLPIRVVKVLVPGFRVSELLQ